MTWLKIISGILSIASNVFGALNSRAKNKQKTINKKIREKYFKGRIQREKKKAEYEKRKEARDKRVDAIGDDSLRETTRPED